MEEGVFPHWADLPLVLQHAVGAAALQLQQLHQLEEQGTDEQPRMEVADVWLGCRPLRDGVDAARTRLRVTHEVQPGEQRLQMLPMPVDAARFMGLRRLDIDLRRAPNQRQGARSSVHLEGPPAWLQELFLDGICPRPIVSLPPGASMPQLHTLVVELAGLPSVFDCAQFPGLQHLELRYCSGLKHLANLASCSSLCVLKITVCRNLVSGLESDVLSQLQRLEQLVLRDVNASELDVAALSPSLTHLIMNPPASNLDSTINLSPPGGVPRTSLRYLGLHGAAVLINWDLSPAPNLETLSICHNTQLPPVLALSGVPHLKHLDAAHAQLQALDLSAARSSLVSLCVDDTPLQALDLTGFTALSNLDCCAASQLHTLDPTSCQTISRVKALLCLKLCSLNLAGCTALRQLYLSGSSALTQLDLSACVSLLELNMDRSGVAEVDVGACAALEKVLLHAGGCWAGCDDHEVQLNNRVAEWLQHPSTATWFSPSQGPVGSVYDGQHSLMWRAMMAG